MIINGKTTEEREAELEERKANGFLVPVKALKWYDRSVRVWDIWVEDKYGNQVGECEHCCGKALAEKIRKEMEEEIK